MLYSTPAICLYPFAKMCSPVYRFFAFWNLTSQIGKKINPFVSHLWSRLYITPVSNRYSRFSLTWCIGSTETSRWWTPSTPSLPCVRIPSARAGGRGPEGYRPDEPGRKDYSLIFLRDMYIHANKNKVVSPIVSERAALTSVSNSNSPKTEAMPVSDKK